MSKTYFSFLIFLFLSIFLSVLSTMQIYVDSLYKILPYDRLSNDDRTIHCIYGCKSSLINRTEHQLQVTYVNHRKYLTKRFLRPSFFASHRYLQPLRLRPFLGIVNTQEKVTRLLNYSILSDVKQDLERPQSDTNDCYVKRP